MRLSTILAVILFFSVTLAFAGTKDQGCWNGRGQLEREFGPYQLRVEPVQGEQHELICRAVLQDKNGRKFFGASEFSISVNPVTGASVTNDGIKSIVLEGFSGGAHCCFTYWIVALGERPGLAREIRNESPAAFDREKDGRVIITTRDGAFDYFDDLPHAIAPMPTVFLQLSGTKLADVSDQFIATYDNDIEGLHQHLKPESVEAFRFGPAPDMRASHEDSTRWLQTNVWMETKARVLSIVLDYLYSGRDQQAWNALDELWPAADRDRIAKLIVETRARGILAHTSKQ